ncbi:cell division protein FtsL [Limosilactobacillus sp.]|uniref:cell division protein FtsL n=1 Tax=Limosilactobacillus sp. TaxID=2773925 RepID=UPI0025C5C9FC|nr:cell division protein FtsL [Limosilactobacillus sp.]MCH3927179.1 cell division protein FtsL [Limosilactobacillus sp.]
MSKVVSNTARELKEQPEIKQTPVQRPAANPRAVGWSPFERLLVTVGGVVTLCLVIALLSTKVAINNQQHHLQDLQSQISKVKNANTSSQQEIAELTSQSHLKAAAHKYGLSDRNSNVRNINQ